MHRKKRADFAENLTKFVKMMKDDDELQGFVISGKKSVYLRQTLSRLAKEKIGKDRFKIVAKRNYSTYYPEFMTASVID